MSTLAENPDVLADKKKIIYWTSPVFTKEGSVDKQKIIDFLIQQVPNNHFNTETPNTWNTGEEFEVHFSDSEKSEQIIFRCKLEITGNKDNYSVQCTLCEPRKKAPLVLRKRSAEIAELISGPGN